MIKTIKSLSGFIHATAISSFSMVLGLAREIVCAKEFGAGRQMDLFLYGFLLYDLLLPATRDIPSGVQGYVNTSDAERFGHSIRIVVTACAIFGGFAAISGLVVYGWIGAPALEGVITPANWRLTIVLLALATFLAMLHAGICTFHVHEGNVKFQLYQPVWLNVGMVFGVLLLSARLGVASLAFGVLTGTVLLLVHEVYAKRAALFSIIFSRRGSAEPTMRNGLLITMAFVLAQAVGSKGSVLVERTVGLSLSPGGLSLLNYAIRLWGIPISLFVIAATLPMVPRVARARIDGNADQMYRIFSLTILGLLLVFLITTAGLWLFSEDIVRLIFQSGKFSATDTDDVAHILTVLLFGSYGAAMSTVAARILWILNRSHEMALITWASVGMYFVAAYPLVHSFGIVGLAVGNVFHYNVQAILCAIVLKREFSKLGVTHLKRVDPARDGSA
jgi:putative peptidoglycan lipid II flippase